MDAEWTHAKGRSLAVVNLTRDLRALVFFETGDDGVTVKEVRVLSRELVTNPRVLLREWEPGVAYIATPQIRMLPLGDLRQELMALQKPSGVQEVTSYNVKDRTTQVGGLSFRRPQDLEAAIQRANVAIRYEQLILEGEPAPTQRIAREFFGNDETKARNVVSAARRSGLLTEATPGQPGGRTTQKCQDFSRAVRKEGDK